MNKYVYLCGPTLYSDIHIGNARSLVFFDVLVKALREKYNVTYARNITDIDQKIIERCGEMSPHKWVAENFIEQYHNDNKRLRLDPPDYEPKVSDSLYEIILVISRMLSKKYAYRVDDGVVFDTSKIKNYGSISGRPNKNERFYLWKLINDKNLYVSPWGLGVPGWHTECVSMIFKHFGTGGIDIHGGGTDLCFPHHENENAQYQALFNTDISKKWLRVGQLTVDGKKMSKSLGNIVLLKDVLKEWSGNTVRKFFLRTKYSKPMDFSFSSLFECEKLSMDQALLTGKDTLELLPNFLTDYRTRL